MSRLSILFISFTKLALRGLAPHPCDMAGARGLGPMAAILKSWCYAPLRTMRRFRLEWYKRRNFHLAASFGLSPRRLQQTYCCRVPMGSATIIKQRFCQFLLLYIVTQNTSFLYKTITPGNGPTRQYSVCRNDIHYDVISVWVMAQRVLTPVETHSRYSLAPHILYGRSR